MRKISRRGFLLSSLCLTAASCLRLPAPTPVFNENPAQSHEVDAIKFAFAPYAPGVGTVYPWCGDRIPQGWIKCEGQRLLRRDYPELYKVLGVTYGTDLLHRSFRVPDFRGSDVYFGRVRSGGKSTGLSTLREALRGHSVAGFPSTYIMKV